MQEVTNSFEYFLQVKTVTSELRQALARARARSEVEGQLNEGSDKPDKEQTKWNRKTEKNTRLNSLSNAPAEIESPVKKKLESRRIPTDELPPPPPSDLPWRNNSTKNVDRNNRKSGPVKSNQFVKSRYDTDSNDDGSDSDEDGTSTLSRLVKQKQKEMMRK